MRPVQIPEDSNWTEILALLAFVLFSMLGRILNWLTKRKGGGVEIEPGSLFKDYSVTLSAAHNFSHQALDDVLSLKSWGDAHILGYYSMHARGTFLNYWSSDANLTFSQDHPSFSKTRSGPGMLDPGSATLRWNVNTDARKMMSLRGSLTYKQGFFERLGFNEVDKSQFPQKIWNDCAQCPEFPNCNEIALIINVNQSDI